MREEDVRYALETLKATAPEPVARYIERGLSMHGGQWATHAMEGWRECWAAWSKDAAKFAPPTGHARLFARAALFFDELAAPQDDVLPEG